jgi:hypothetical protein
MIKNNIKDWYVNEYPTDEMGEDINAEATFEGLFKIMDNYKDVYEYIGAYDSIIRERIFEKLAEIMGVDYDYIYSQWLIA